jgi:hypothetical protein
MQQRLFLTRGLLAVVWAVVFAMASGSLSTGAGVLLVLYPLIDAVASAVDARDQQGSARQVLEFNAVLSTAAAVALGSRRPATRVTSSSCSASGPRLPVARSSLSPSVGG